MHFNKAEIIKQCLERRCDVLLERTEVMNISDNLHTGAELLLNAKKNFIDESISDEESSTSTFKDSDNESVNSMDFSSELDSSSDEMEIRAITSSNVATTSRQIEDLSVSQITTKRNRHFCIYCKCLIVNLPRHLESVHPDIPDVKEFIWLPKLCPERKKLIDKIRKRGDFQFNTNTNYNNGQLIVCRRSTLDKSTKCFEDYVACPNCKGFMSKKSMYRHYQLCDTNACKGSRNVLLRGKKLTARWTNLASPALKDRVLPSLRDDDIGKLVRYDSLIVLFGNKLCEKYKSEHLNKYIRQILRTLGRLLKSIKLQNKLVTDFASIFNPRLYDSLLLAVNEMSGLNASCGTFMKPTLAFNIGTYIKKCGKLLITHYIKNEDMGRISTVENFLKILDEDYSSSVNKTAMENQNECQRQKTVELPCTKDIESLINYLHIERDKCSRLLRSSFNMQDWLKLAKCCLTFTQIFNRRRAGETERILLKDFQKHHTIDKETDPDLYQNLNVNGQNSANNFVRIQIRGKLGRTVSVLLQTDWLKSLTLVVKYREDAGVLFQNPYLFGIPGGATNHNHLRACDLLRTFAVQCGATNPQTLRGTLLRKHFATVVQNLNLRNGDMALVANFMGHDEKIHRSHYRIPIVAKEIGQMSHLLNVVANGDIKKYRGLNLEEMCNEDVESNSYVRTLNLDREVQTCNEFLRDQELNEPPILQEITNNSLNNYEDLDCKILRNERTPTKTQQPLFAKLSLIKRKGRTWTTPEKHAARNACSAYLKNRSLPSNNDAKKIIADNPILNGRSMQQLRLWVHNQINKSNQGNSSQSWTTPEKSAVRQIFSKQIKRGQPPYLTECEDAVITNPELRRKSSKLIKAWVTAEIKRNSKKSHPK